MSTEEDSCDEMVRLLRLKDDDPLMRKGGKLLKQAKCRGTIRATVSNLVQVVFPPPIARCSCEKYNGEFILPQTGDTCFFNSHNAGGSAPGVGWPYIVMHIWWDLITRTGTWGTSPGPVWRMTMGDLNGVNPEYHQGAKSWWYCAAVGIRGISPGKYCPIGNWILTGYMSYIGGCLKTCHQVGPSTHALVTTEWVE